MSKPLTYEQIREFINGEEGNGCLLLTSKEEFEEEKIKQNKCPTETKLYIRCKCGNEFYKNYGTFKGRNEKQCKDCGKKLRHKKETRPIEKVYDLINSKGYHFIKWIDDYKNSYSKFIIECCNNHLWESCYHNLNRSDCPECFNEIKPELYRKNKDDILEFIKNDNRGFSLISGLDEYKKNTDELTFKCKKNHIFQMSWSNYRSGNNCPMCTKKYQSEIHKGKSNPQYIDGRSTIVQILRVNMKPWKKDCMANANYKCCITSVNEKYLHIHHLKSFSKIIDIICSTFNVKLKDNINSYTQAEIDKLIDLNLKLHYDGGLGIVLCKSIHKLFHKTYGNRNNTPTQFLEFVHRLEDHEFDTYLKENNLTLNINYEVLKKLLKQYDLEYK